ncbi:MAG: serine/threonine-protein phosphatase [Solobacterium sp.]|nr:serine/threonine-protein phosphatase [Solobacterium sp.]
MIHLTYAAATHPGKIRSGNEDNFRINDEWKKDLQLQEFSLHGYHPAESFLAVVCDGMGGEANGEIASLHSVEQFQRHSIKELPSAIIEDLNHANDVICEMIVANKGIRSGSTVCSLYADEGCIYCMSLGDSRIYHFHNGILTRLTKDQNRAQALLEAGLISEEQAKHFPKGKVLMQYIGIFPEESELLPQIIGPQKMIEDDIYLLCSDGLTDMVSDEEIQDILQNQSPEKMTDALISLANLHGGKDNITAIVIRLTK